MKKRLPQAAIYDEAAAYPSKITVNHLPQLYRLTETCTATKNHPSKARGTTGTNCATPFCFQKIGLERWDKFRKTPKSDESKRYKARSENTPCGLYNNANLCYLNSFLQIWFNNVHFKKFVFSYKSVPSFVNPVNANGIGIKVQKIMERLQNVFFSLELSPFEATDAVRLADALMLQDSQQDVSEFHTLFFNFMEKHLEGHPCYQGFKQIHERVNFRSKQVIECVCGRLHEQEQVNAGLHLNPDGCTTVSQMIKNAFAPNHLGDYRCPDCLEIGNSNMRNVPCSLPPVLIFQIARVALDHKKDRTAIFYPRELNESTLLSDARGHHKYFLAAVCVHDGTAASSGHYHDFVFDNKRRQWFNFNDANVKPVKPPGVETEADQCKASSDMRGCYLLVYRRDTDLTAEKDHIVLPPRAQVIKKRIGIESESLRHSNERSERLWFKRAQEVHGRLEKMVVDLRVPSADLAKKKPSDVVFLPSSLIFDIVDKSYKAIETMVNLNQLEDSAAEERKQRRKENRALEQAALVSGNNGNNSVSASPSKATMNRLQNKYGDIDDLTPAMIADIERTMNNSGSPPAKQARTTNGRTRRTSSRVAAAHAEAPSTPSQVYIADSSDESDIEEREPDDATYAHLYLAEPLDYHEMPVCLHGKVPLAKVLLGEVKAVRRTGAEKLLKDYGILMRKKVITHNEGNASTEVTQGQWLSASELCVQCADDLRAEALFSRSIDEVEPMIQGILRDNSRSVTKNCPPQRNMLLVSRKDLTAHRRLALQQHEFTQKKKEVVTNSLCFMKNCPEPEAISPRPRKRKQTNESENNSILPLPSAAVVSPPEKNYEVRHDPSSPLKIKLLVSKPSSSQQEPSTSTAAYANGNAYDSDEKPCSSKSLPQRNGNGKANVSAKNSTPKKRVAPVADSDASDGMASSEEDDESDTESDPDWNGRESPKNGKRKKYRGVGSPKKKKKVKKPPKKKKNQANPADSNGDAAEATETESEITPPAHPVIFNSDIVCNHTNVRHGAKMVRITEAEWARIVTPFFDEFYKFSADCVECTDCEEEKHREQQNNQFQRQVINHIFGDLSGLLRILEKRKYKNEELGDAYDYVICGRFLEAFRTAARSRSASVSVPPLCQGCLMCDHDKPFVVLDPNGGSVVANALPLTTEEWELISGSYKRHYPDHSDTVVDIKLDESGACENHCSECYIEYCAREDRKRYEYVDSGVFVKVKGDEDDCTDRKKSNRALQTRRTASRNCFKLVLSSTSTVFDVKLEMCRRMGFSPNDQLLINGDQILENNKTLGASRVEANNEDNPILLVVQCHDDDSRGTDRGFQDTALAF